jgi:hypothetical protein
MMRAAFGHVIRFLKARIVGCRLRLRGERERERERERTATKHCRHFIASS